MKTNDYDTPSLLLFLVGVFLLLKSLFDFYGVLFPSIPVERVVYKDYAIELIFSYLAFVYGGVVAWYSSSKNIKIFHTIITGICFCIVCYSIYVPSIESSSRNKDCVEGIQSKCPTRT